MQTWNEWFFLNFLPFSVLFTMGYFAYRNDWEPLGLLWIILSAILLVRRP